MFYPKLLLLIMNFQSFFQKEYHTYDLLYLKHLFDLYHFLELHFLLLLQFRHYHLLHIFLYKILHYCLQM